MWSDGVSTVPARPHTPSNTAGGDAGLHARQELPEFRDNFESRLIMLKRRLDERGGPIRIEKTGRGRFRLLVDAQLRLEDMGG